MYGGNHNVSNAQPSTPSRGSIQPSRHRLAYRAHPNPCTRPDNKPRREKHSRVKPPKKRSETAHALTRINPSDCCEWWNITPSAAHSPRTFVCGTSKPCTDLRHACGYHGNVIPLKRPFGRLAHVLLWLVSGSQRRLPPKRQRRRFSSALVH